MPIFGLQLDLSCCAGTKKVQHALLGCGFFPNAAAESLSMIPLKHEPRSMHCLAWMQDIPNASANFRLPNAHLHLAHRYSISCKRSSAWPNHNRLSPIEFRTMATHARISATHNCSKSFSVQLTTRIALSLRDRETNPSYQ